MAMSRRVASKPTPAPRRSHQVQGVASLLPDSSAWHAGLLRVTVFPILDPKMGGEGWWEALVGAAPEVRSSQPRQSIVQEAGPYLNGQLTLNVSPLRIDWVLTPTPQEELIRDSWPTLGEYPKLVDAYANALTKWLRDAPGIKRMAFGAILFQQVESHKEGYELVGRYLPAVDLDPESSDFLYQINRPRSSSVVDGLKINRLAKWSVGKMQAVHLQITIGAGKEGPAPIMSVPTGELYAARLELDVNTDAMRADAFEAPQDILGELVGMGLELAAKGDLP